MIWFDEHMCYPLAGEKFARTTQLYVAGKGLNGCPLKLCWSLSTFQHGGEGAALNSSPESLKESSWEFLGLVRTP
jgi:hypothetical protein